MSAAEQLKPWAIKPPQQGVRNPRFQFAFEQGYAWLPYNIYGHLYNQFGGMNPHPSNTYTYIAIWVPHINQNGKPPTSHNGMVFLYRDDKGVLRYHQGMPMAGWQAQNMDPEATEESLLALLEDHKKNGFILKWWERQFKLVIEWCKENGYIKEKEAVAS